MPVSRLQPLLQPAMDRIQNPVKALEKKTLLASLRTLDQGQCEQKPSSGAQLWGIPWLTWNRDHLPVNGEHT